MPLVQSEEGLKAFTGFTYRLHRAGIFHGDYTLNNVLYTFNLDGYEFSLIVNDIIRLGHLFRTTVRKWTRKNFAP